MRLRRVPGCSGMPNVGLPELLVIMVVVLLLFGPGRLTEVGRSLGRAVGEFKRAIFSLDTDDSVTPPGDGDGPQRGRRKTRR